MPPVAAIPTNQPKICNLPSKFIDRPNPLKQNVSAGFPFCFPLPHPALPQSARRAAVRSSFLLFDSFPVCLAAPLTGALCPLAIQPAFLHTPSVFRTEDFPCVLPVCKRPKSTLFVRAALFLALGQASRTEALSRLCVHFCSPLPCRGFVRDRLYCCCHSVYNDTSHI